MRGAGRSKRLCIYSCFCIMLVIATACENSEQEIRAFTEKR